MGGLVEEKLTASIIGALFEMYNTLGFGFLEHIYIMALEGKSAAASIGILTFVQISAGSLFSCGLIADGTAYCWGDNTKGQLGDGTLSVRLIPTKVSTGLKFVALSAGNATTCGIAQSGFAYCWGENYGGQLGNGIPDGNSLVLRPSSIYDGRLNGFDRFSGVFGTGVTLVDRNRPPSFSVVQQQKNSR